MFNNTVNCFYINKNMLKSCIVVYKNFKRFHITHNRDFPLLGSGQRYTETFYKYKQFSQRDEQILSSHIR